MRKLTPANAPGETSCIHLQEAASMLPAPDGKRSTTVFKHGTLEVKLYAPRGLDQPSPHMRDEIYVVALGDGWFVNAESRCHFGLHDVLFVKAGAVHRFEDFSDDLLVWVFFYGPAGGESDPA